MPFNHLLLCWLESATSTSVTQQGKTVNFPRKFTADVVLIFKTDSKEYKEKWAVNKPVSDYLFYYTNTEDQDRKVFLVFVELGGNKADHGVEQLRQTIKTMRDELKSKRIAGKAQFSALVLYSGGSSPQDLSRQKKEFQEQYQTILKVKQGIRADAREEFGI